MTESAPALGLLEFESVAAGIVAGDAMVKSAPVATITAGTVHPGRYLVMVTGDVASVEEALAAGRSSGAEFDEVFLPDIDPSVLEAIGGHRREPVGESVGVVETTTVSATIAAADAGVKGADVVLLELHLADDLGGKAYALFAGSVADVDAAVAAALGAVASDRIVGSVVVPMLDRAMVQNLESAPRFSDRISGGPHATR